MLPLVMFRKDKPELRAILPLALTLMRRERRHDCTAAFYARSVAHDMPVVPPGALSPTR